MVSNLSTQLTIGALAERTGLSVSAIRYYEEVGLIPEAMRRPGGHRMYSTDVQELLTLIRHCRDFRFSIDDTRAMVSLATSGGKDCVAALEIAKNHLTTVQARLAELLGLERGLREFVAACAQQCASDAAMNCTVFQDLSLSEVAPAAGSASSLTRHCCR